ncbi:MAG TPA: ATP synthase F0 subunit B [Bryobacteraceae bacterium]|nr:ATP synthase F0 subunit B [Bryobacteraceae bacterium]
MGQTLQALGGLLLQAIPTICLLLIVHFYLKFVFFRPMKEVLEKRRAATEGARESAEAMLKKAAEKADALDAALRKAREEIYQENEATRRKWIDEQTERLEEARKESRARIHQAKIELEAQAAAAKKSLEATAESLAEDITKSLLARRAS